MDDRKYFLISRSTERNDYMLFSFLLILASGVPVEEGGTLFIDSTLAITYLSNCLRMDKVYEDGVLQTAYFMIEMMGKLSDTAESDYTDIAIRIPCDPGEEIAAGDSLPLLDRYRVYTNGQILYFSSIQGIFIPYVDFLSERTEL